jgi:hypothetical protein
MKNITLALPDEAADAFMRLSIEEKTKASFFIEAFTKSVEPESMENILKKAAKEARENGMTEADIDSFLESLS